VSAARDHAKNRSLLSIAAAATLIGIALSAGDNQDLGSWLTLAGLLGLIFGVHRFGRSGPDAPIDFGERHTGSDA
jgi:hypothetical protein